MKSNQKLHLNTPLQSVSKELLNFMDLLESTIKRVAEMENRLANLTGQLPSIVGVVAMLYHPVYFTDSTVVAVLKFIVKQTKGGLVAQPVRLHSPSLV